MPMIFEIIASLQCEIEELKRRVRNLEECFP